jgi:hypothetical protein
MEIEDVVNGFGDQRYVPPKRSGTAVRVAVSPSQMETSCTEISGTGIMVTVALTGELEHPFTLYISE